MLKATEHVCICTKDPLPCFDVLYISVPSLILPKVEVWRCSECRGWEDERTLQIYLRRDTTDPIESEGGFYSRTAQTYF